VLLALQIPFLICVLTTFATGGGERIQNAAVGFNSRRIREAIFVALH
jgi:hypothetical protein